MKRMLMLMKSSATTSKMRIGLRSIAQFSYVGRQRSAFPSHSYSSSAVTSHDAYIALGSNLGDKIHNINAAIERLRGIGKLKCTSLLYESKPMYIVDQDAFLNAVCLLETDLGHLQLLDALKGIETDLGRRTTFKNGPRVIDLDILMLSDQLVDEDRLEIPHPRIAERSFVLKPLCDIDPNLVHPVEKKTVKEMLQALPDGDMQNLHSVIPLGKDCNGNYIVKNMEERPIIMGILNVTPDSFSDGGKHLIVEDAVESAEEMLQHGADIIDIGGESTRPGALEIEVEEEIRRVIPVIQAIKQRNSTCVISVDTRKADVAKAALVAGADIVNDVSGGCFDPNMYQLVSSYKCPMIIMHSRGTPETMQELAKYEEDRVAVTVQQELQGLLTRADFHIPRWLQIVDLGIGFAKSFEHNMSLMNPSKVRNMKSSLGNRTMLVGPSRKRFIGTLINQASNKSIDTEWSVEDKDWGTAGACCASIMGGANIFRVHNVKGIKHACDVFHSCISGRYQ